MGGMRGVPINKVLSHPISVSFLRILVPCFAHLNFFVKHKQHFNKESMVYCVKPVPALCVNALAALFFLVIFRFT